MTLAARARSRPFVAGLVCGGAHAACYALMFPPAFLWGLAFVALAPLMWLAWALGGRHEGTEAGRHEGVEGDRVRSGLVEEGVSRRMMRRALLGVFLAAAPMWAWHHLWIWTVTNAGFPVLILYLCIYEPLFVWLGARWRRWVSDGWKFWLALPVIWVGLEMLRGAIVWDGYAWFFVGHPTIQSDDWLLGTIIGSTASRFGAYAISLFVATIASVTTGVVALSRGWNSWVDGAKGIVLISAAILTLFLGMGFAARAFGSPGLSLWSIVLGMFAAGLLLLVVCRRGLRHAGVGMGFLTLVVACLFGLSAEWTPLDRNPELICVAVVQTNVPQDNKVAWKFEQRRVDFERFKAMTRGASAYLDAQHNKADVIVWPETMFPGLALNEEAVRVERGAGLIFGGAPGSAAGGAGTPSTVFRDELVALQQEVGIPMVVGAIAKDGLRIDTVEEPDGRRHVEIDAAATFNSAFVIADGVVLPERYDKVKLTPFGEYMPYISWSEWLEKKLLALGAGGMRFDLGAGRQYQELRVPISQVSEPPHPSSPEAGDATLAHQGRGKSDQEESGQEGSGQGAKERSLGVATPICFEATAPGVCKRLVFEGGWSARRKAEVILNLTNDGWFADSPGAHENHLLLARWRCVELGTPMVRAANTGVSCSIDASGRVTNRLEKRTEGVMRAVVALPARGPTIYARTGDVAGWACLGLTGLMAGATLVNGRAARRRKGKVGSAADGHNAPAGAEGAKR